MAALVFYFCTLHKRPISHILYLIPPLFLCTFIKSAGMIFFIFILIIIIADVIVFKLIIPYRRFGARHRKKHYYLKSTAYLLAIAVIPVLLFYSWSLFLKSFDLKLNDASSIKKQKYYVSDVCSIITGTADKSSTGQVKNP